MKKKTHTEPIKGSIEYKRKLNNIRVARYRKRKKSTEQKEANSKKYASAKKQLEKWKLPSTQEETSKGHVRYFLENVENGRAIKRLEGVSLERQQKRAKRVGKSLFIKAMPEILGEKKTHTLKTTNEETFDTCVENRLAKVKELLIVKGKEYVRGEDKFHNFERAAEMNRQTPTRALHGMNSKHLVSILDMLDDIDNGKLIDQKHLEEKVGDAIVYFVLLEALIKHKYLAPGF
jgi:hypothetical protein